MQCQRVPDWSGHRQTETASLQSCIMIIVGERRTLMILRIVLYVPVETMARENGRGQQYGGRNIERIWFGWLLLIIGGGCSTHGWNKIGVPSLFHDDFGRRHWSFQRRVVIALVVVAIFRHAYNNGLCSWLFYFPARNVLSSSSSACGNGRIKHK